jgi:endonuclease/exonuclease/phosphatase family metal-dependent hydrolase
MILSLLQLNINADNYWEQLSSYLTSHNFDILQLQEVAGKDALAGNINSKRDCYKELQHLLSDRYHSELAIAQIYLSNPSSGYIGNATFYKKQFKLLEKNIITLHKRITPFPPDAKSYEDVGRNVLHLKLEINNKSISFLNTHLAWAKRPQEENHQTEQGQILIDYLEHLTRPFILTGDFNLDPNQPLIQKINTFARNHITENHITNTLNPHTHEIGELIRAKKVEIAVDYIFTSPDITVNKFAVIQEDLSDHLGLTTTIEI